ncbi:MAG: GTPase [Myxococcales bacterium]|nr:GTPase [Myxococcales bacterium]
MSSINLFTREISIKIVYYGPGLGGKTSSLQYVHRALKPDSRGQLVSLATGADRTLYFDFLPVKLPKLRGYSIRVQLYTVPGQVHYNATRKLVLAGADGIVFVADSQVARDAANNESLENLGENLAEQGLRLADTPHVLQYNKRDLPDAMGMADLDARLNRHRVPSFETVAAAGKGVFDSLKAITTLVLNDLRRRGLWDGGSVAPRQTPSPEFREDPESIGHKLAALSEAADAMSDLEAPPFDLRKTTVVMSPGMPPLSGMNRRGGPGLSDILPLGMAREAAIAVENEIDRGDYALAIRVAVRAFTDAAAHAASGVGDEAPMLHALLLGLPGERYLRFRDIARRAEGGASSSADALFALFFLVDAALRK